MSLHRLATFTLALVAVALLPTGGGAAKPAYAQAGHPAEQRPNLSDYPINQNTSHPPVWPQDALPNTTPAINRDGTRSAARTSAGTMAAGTAFLTRPYYGFHSVTSVFDHCNPDYSIDGKICAVEGTIALKTNGYDPYFPKGYAQTRGGKDYLYYDGHNGWDIALAYEPLLAAAAGTVTYADWDVSGCATCGYGMTVIIDHGNGFSTRYGHLSRIDVRNGQAVYRGQEIGISGNTGSSTGAHLHFGLYLTSSWTAIDPWGWEGAPGGDPWAQYDSGNLWLLGNPQDPVPTAPTNVTAVQHPGSATVSWTSPAFDGGSGMTECVATSSPGNQIAVVAPTATTATVKGLSNGTSYTFTVICASQANMGVSSQPSNAVTPVPTVPDPPAAVKAAAGNQTATVTWQAPAFDGQSPITGYQVTPYLNGQALAPSTTTSPATTATIQGLPDGSPYTFTVAAINAVGTGAPANLASNPVVPIAGGKYVPVQPARILDTRAATQVGARSTPLGKGETYSFPVAGIAGTGVPGVGVSAVVLNVTATNTTAPSYLTVFPAGVARPTASNLNWAPNQTVPESVEVALGPSGQVSTFNFNGAADLVVDLEGYVTAPTTSDTTDGIFNPVTPARVMDTRPDTQVGPYGAPLQPGGIIAAQVAGVAGSGVPAAGVAAVVLNVTVTQPTDSGFLTLWPAGAGQPTASSLNWQPGQTVANQVVVKVGPGGQIQAFNSSGFTHLVIDVEGWYTAPGSTAGGTGFVGLTPCRALDTRTSGQPVLGGATQGLFLAGTCGVPGSGAHAVAISVTATGTTASSYLSVWPDQTTRPTASSLNWVKGATVPNLVVVPLGPDGAVDLFNYAGSADVIVDVVGWYG